MANRSEHIKLTGDTHPPEVEWDPDLPATPAEVGLQSRPAMFGLQESGDEFETNAVDEAVTFTPAPARTRAGTAVAALVAGLVLLTLFR